MAHPLNGADIRTLRRITAEAGSGTDRGKLAAIYGAAIGRLPFTIAERAMATRLPAADAHGAPIFILGHWRSGTTHAYNLMATAGFATISPIAAGLPHELLTIGQGFRPLLERALPESRYIDNVRVTPESPQEDEPAIANMTPYSFYHALYFPKRFDFFLERGLFHDHMDEGAIAEWETCFSTLMSKIAHVGAKGGRGPLLIKNPVYTARPAQIRRLFPDARFVHIHRDPYDVVLSMRNFYAKLLPVMALQPYDHVDVERSVLRTYDRMMSRYTEETAGWDERRLVEVSYRELDDDPMAALFRIYEQLGLDGFGAAAPTFRTYLDSIDGYRKNRFAQDETDRARVRSALPQWFKRYGDDQ